MSQTENILKPIPVGNLLLQHENKPAFRFFIPSYQRGYRWDKEHVEDLLNDIFEFITFTKSKDQKYCIQPIVVKQTPDGSFEVMDGQQRLTTIFILLSRLKKTNAEIDLFSLEYDTRPNSAEYLKSLNGSISDENPDYYYISNAYVTIDDWLKRTKALKPNIAGSLFNALVESIEFIWYEITGQVDAIDVFTRINIGKIPLTNAELVKAVFLSQNNLSLGFASADISEKDFLQILSLKQNAIAIEWDEIEKTLQDPKLWGFLSNDNDKYETRIDYLLDLHSRKSSQEANLYYSFKFFYDRVQNVRADTEKLMAYSNKNYTFIEEEWTNLKMTFDILLEWYSNKTYNHILGFLIYAKTDVSVLIKEFKDFDKAKFLGLVMTRVKHLIGCNDISMLRYHTHRQKLDRLLLFHNVYNSLNSEDNLSYPFEKIKNNSWSLEHIFAQNSDDLREEHYEQWLTDHIEYFESIKGDDNAAAIAESIKSLISSNSRIEKEDFQDCFSKATTFIAAKIDAINETLYAKNNTDQTPNGNNQEDNDWVTDDDSIANLALLDGSTNSAIKNSLFEIKRTLILERDKKGLFIPGETRKIFLKYYTLKPSHLAYWTYKDRLAYIDTLNTTLTFINAEHE